MPFNNLTEEARRYYASLVTTLEQAGQALSADAFLALQAHVCEDLDEVLFDLTKGKLPSELLPAIRVKHNL